MSKTKKKKKKKTRLKGTATRKPCVDCGKEKDRFKDFKPRWAGCATHKTEKGRRYYQEGCDDCAKIVNGNIRQPRCIGCDKARPKKRNKKKQADPKPTETKAAVNVDPNPTLPPAPAPKVGDRVPSPEDGPEAEAVIQAVVDVAPMNEAVTVEPQDEASDESEDVTPAPAPTPERPKIASMADLSKLFGGE